MAIDMLPESPADEPVDEKSAVASVTVSENTEDTVVEQIEELDAVEVADSNEPFDLAVGVSDEAVLPTMITIPRLEKTIPVLNPTSRTIADLDDALLDGVVRHPDSANLAQEGNVFILGHSSYLPNVLNRNFQAFNGIQNLEWGDTIEVQSEGAVYEYRVEKVYRASAQDVTVPIAGTGNMLTLATCNSFGSVDDRYIVEAKRIDVRKL